MPSRHPESPFLRLHKGENGRFFGKRKSGLFHSIFKFHGLGRTRTLIYQPWYQGTGLMDPPPPPPRRVFYMFSISKRFCLQWKASDLFNKIMYILWVVALLEACDVTAIMVGILYFTKN